MYRDEAEKSLTRLTIERAHWRASAAMRPCRCSVDFDYDDGTPDSAPLVSHLKLARMRQGTRAWSSRTSARRQAGKDGTAFR